VPRKGTLRRRRERRPLPSTMLHQDSSRREWLEVQPALDLIVTMDDRVDPTAASTIAIRYDRFTS
jgi:hypothetical protein